MSDVAFTSAWWRFKLAATQLFVEEPVKANNIENPKALITGPLWGESTGHPSQKTSNEESVSTTWSHHGKLRLNTVCTLRFDVGIVV